MNGRLYDPKLHTFLMPDNFVQQPENTQNYNRYAYVLNNPLRYTDPSGELIDPISIGLAIGIGAFIGAATYYIGLHGQEGGWSWSGLAQATFIGAASAAVTFGIGSAAGSMFTQAATGFWQGAVQGAIVGAITGAGGAIVNGIFNGGNITLKEVLGGALIGGAIGAVAGGIKGGLNAQKNGLSFWKGQGVISEQLAIPIPVTATGSEPVEYSNSSAKEFSMQNSELNKHAVNVKTLHADGSTPAAKYGYRYNQSEGVYYNSKGQKVAGLTMYDSTFNKKSVVYLAKTAFVSREQLYLTMNHEYMHAKFYSLGFLNLNNDSGHSIIHNFEADQISMWGGNPTLSQYYPPNFCLNKINYSKYGFNLILNLP